MERCRNYLTPFVVEPFIVRLVQIGALPIPEGGVFTVESSFLQQAFSWHVEDYSFSPCLFVQA